VFLNLKQQLAEEIAGFTRDPLGYCYYAFPWGEGELSNSKGPYVWQGDVLRYLTNHLQNPRTQYTPCLVSVSSGHGVGKSAFVGMISQWGMSTCEDCRIVMTANSDPQLRTKTWPEVSKWFRLAINEDWFSVNAESIHIKDSRHERTWRTDRLTWSVPNPQAFAGLHNAGKRIIVIFDEASEIDDVIWDVTQGALTDANTEIIWMVFSNPTQNTGRFRECWGRFKHRWKGFQIDSRNVENTNKEELDGWVKDFGEDSDFVRVKVRGEFPRAGSCQLIPSDVVAACRKYKAEGCHAFPKIFGVDVARFGDDSTVITMRQGRKAEVLARYRGLDTSQVTAHVIEFIAEHNPDAVVVDSDGIGNTVFDQLKFQGYGRLLYEFHGGKPANNAVRYFNRRAEVWGLMRDWLKANAEIPDEPEIEMDLTGPQYGFSAQQQIQLERKEDLKKRGLSSPDYGDSLAYTFAVQILAPQRAEPVREYYSPGERELSWLA
jgi:hypothetical protein